MNPAKGIIQRQHHEDTGAAIVRNEPLRKHSDPRKYPANIPNHSSMRTVGAMMNNG